ncbi:MAG: toll/interleukin-1 receptor domain-containing protein [Deltaproteobacteria bacterium]|nr:MAG: toll/interleukin-1 receptor domain-containing protein [Deltaproteobacteria bacterium]
MGALVFISHSSQDHGVAVSVCEALERRGVGCWLASRDISPGDNFQEAIVTAISSVRAMVLVFTGSANNSDEIKKEIALASHSHLAVIPVRVEDVLPTGAFLYELSTRQWIDAFDDWDVAMSRLADQIGGMARGSAAAPAVPASPTDPAAARNLSGKWVTSPLINPYDRNTTSTLHFELEQSGDALFGTVREKTDVSAVVRGIQGGQIKGDTVVFYTQGVTTSGNGMQPYKEHYHGTLKGGAIEFIRQNDVATGGLPEKFTATRE